MKSKYVIQNQATKIRALQLKINWLTNMADELVVSIENEIGYCYGKHFDGEVCPRCELIKIADFGRSRRMLPKKKKD